MIKRLYFIVVIFLIEFISLKSSYGQNIKQYEGEQDSIFKHYVNKNIDSIFKIECKYTNLLCYDTSELKYNIFYRLIPNSEITQFDSSLRLINYLQIDTKRPSSVQVYYKSNFIGIFAYDATIGKPIFNFVNESIIKKKSIIDSIQNLKPDMIFSIRCFFITFGYLKNNELYLYDHNEEIFLNENEYLKKYDLINGMKKWFKLHPPNSMNMLSAP